ncbi:Dynein heavy chain 1, axonemal [Cyphomyrmex costatus]|uniref:Dynein heavy chain 1, axonemal n=1 Tax=Cyphomyrmex costatus TaxID=456900 RepID=A0A195CQ90_9HYME|nr:Dynein heavy chain 1, axonemal [Cyphomyrmex costatus]
MERRRKVYKNLKIEDALKAEGIKPSDMLPFEKIRSLLSDEEKYGLYSKISYLSLELFDDEEYDCRTTEEWINLGIVNGTRYPLPALVFVERITDKKWIFDRYDILNNLFGWFHAAVTDYDNKRKLWTVLILDGLKRKFLLPRIYIQFLGEDPRKFAKRVAAAIKQRQIAEINIRYHFYLDCMLVDDIPTLDEKQQEVIVMSKTKNFFCCTILYVLPEVYEAINCVIVECSNILNMNLFVSNYGKSMYLLEFKSQQQQETDTVIKYLEEMWVERIIQSVRLCFRDIEKEWFNLEQKNHDEYDIMKLKRFMTLIAYRMQDALRNLVKKSMALYLEILETPALCTLNVDENFVWGDDLINTHFKSPVNPIFIIDIAMNDETAYYLTNLESFEEIIIDILDNSLKKCQHIKQVHPFLLPFLKFPEDLYLSPVDLLEEQVYEVRERLRTAYQKSTIPLKAYVKEYQQYLEIYKLNVEKYVENFKKADHSITEIRDEVSFHFRMKSILELTLPKDIVIGPFCVNVRPLRDFLIQKRQSCCTQLLIMFTESLRTKIDVVLSDYVQIRTRLRTTPRNIEHLFEEQDWIETVPLRVKKLDEIVQKLKFQYDILDHFWWNLTDEDFETKWQAIGFPRQVQLYIEEAKNRFASEYEKFHKVQMQEEILLSERIDTLMGNVINVTLQTDINKVHEMAVEVKRILKIMKECQELGLLLNERQKLFGMNVVPYEQLNKLIKEFEPYQTLWITASDN